MRARRQTVMLGLIVWAVAVISLPRVGITDDDDFYLPAGHAYVRWVQNMTSEPQLSSRVDQLDAHFNHNREHPPLAKWLIGGGRWLGHEVLGLWNASEAGRIGICAMLALAAMVVFGFLHPRAGPLAAWFGGLALVLIPRFAFHGRVPTLDMTVAATTSLFLLVFWRLHRRPGWRPMVLMGLVFGLAMASKLNAPFALIGCGLYWLAETLHRSRVDRGGVTLPPVPLWMLVVPAVGFALHIALWPHMWVDTINRYGAYVAFHTKHYPIYLFYEGLVWERPFAPWHASFSYAWATLPTMTLAAGLIGIGHLSLRLLRSGDEGRFARFLLIHMVVAIGTVAFSPVPKYGGVKLFLPFFPLFAVAAGLGFARLQKALGPSAQKPALAAALFALMLSSGAADSLRFADHPLSAYAQHVGGLPGAVQRGYERQYYDMFDRGLSDWIAEHHDLTQSLHFEPNHKEYRRSAPYMIRRGLLPPGLQLTSSRRRADVVILTHERRWRSFSDLAAELAERPVLHEHAVDGVVLWTAYGAKP